MRAKIIVAAAACGFVALPAWGFTTQMQFDGGSIQQLYQIRKQQDAAYWRQVEEIVAGRLRSLRVAEERAAAAKAGHPVKLPTGACQVIATIQADGTVARSQLGQCSHQSIGDDMLKAVQQASPLPPYGRPVNMTITLNANVSIPGEYGE